ncbi:hypothetical protein B9J93_10460 [Vibrio sp. V17_P4S1T151]|uniref:hypothetical protein n=1 Tax=unclassified Vibrio TaxID=2614977 RepID=UPI000B8EAC06|nr:MULTISPECIES: hypothetical protein [unclassified Vibrio]OXX45780.1 hypothetical protein B9J93_10460 [Vibrio sp. V17_P4S1T151]OXX63999.1 hypothetical protein B9J89_05675 [Vibrio sp. V15_P4S5T153]
MTQEDISIKELSFEPEILKVDAIEFRPFMIECAFDYYQVCIESRHQRMGIQTVMSALVIEVLLKSFNARVTGNVGRLDETYEFDRKAAISKNSNAHDLITLYEALPSNLKNYLFDDIDLEILEVNRSLFSSSRYVYEAKANKIHNDDIIKLAARLICKIVCLYRKQNCNDPFINEFDVEKLFLSHNHPVWW